MALKEEMMREITRKLTSLNISEEDIGQIDLNSMWLKTPGAIVWLEKCFDKK
ncbi:MAG: hypothetical protein ACRC2T_10550 [Thermoguttaceae bacterium]